MSLKLIISCRWKPALTKAAAWTLFKKFVVSNMDNNAEIFWRKHRAKGSLQLSVLGSSLLYCFFKRERNAPPQQNAASSLEDAFATSLPLTAHFLLLRKWSVAPLGYWKEEKEGMLETYSHLLLDELSKQVIGEIDSLMVKKFRVFPCLWNGWRGLLEKCILSKLSVFLRNVFLLALLSPEYVHLCLQHKFTGTVEAWGRKKISSEGGLWCCYSIIEIIFLLEGRVPWVEIIAWPWLKGLIHINTLPMSLVLFSSWQLMLGPCCMSLVSRRAEMSDVGEMGQAWPPRHEQRRRAKSEMTLASSC